MECGSLGWGTCGPRKKRGCKLAICVRVWPLSPLCISGSAGRLLLLTPWPLTLPFPPPDRSLRQIRRSNFRELPDWNRSKLVIPPPYTFYCTLPTNQDIPAGPPSHLKAAINAPSVLLAFLPRSYSSSTVVHPPDFFIVTPLFLPFLLLPLLVGLRNPIWSLPRQKKLSKT